MPQVIAAIEGAAKLFVAALHGAALGGGYELTLGVRYADRCAFAAQTAHPER